MSSCIDINSVLKKNLSPVAFDEYKLRMETFTDPNKARRYQLAQLQEIINKKAKERNEIAREANETLGKIIFPIKDTIELPELQIIEESIKELEEAKWELGKELADKPSISEATVEKPEQVLGKDQYGNEVSINTGKRIQKSILIPGALTKLYSKEFTDNLLEGIQKVKALLGIKPKIESPINTIPGFFDHIFGGTKVDDVAKLQEGLNTGAIAGIERLVRSIGSAIDFKYLGENLTSAFLGDIIKNPVYHLLNVNQKDKGVTLELPNSVKGTIGLIATKWFLTRGRETVHNTRSSIAQILSITSEEVTPDMIATFTFAGSLRNTITRELGNEILDQLGIGITKEYKKLAPESKQQLVNALGLLAIDGMRNAGLVELNQAIYQVPGEGSRTLQFIRVKTDFNETATTIDPVLPEIYTKIDSKKLRDPIAEVLTKYLTTEIRVGTIQTEPGKPNTRLTNGQRASKNAKKALTKLNNTKFTINKGLWKFFDSFDRDELKEVFRDMLGYDRTVELVDDEGNSVIQINRLKGIKGKNLSIDLNINSLLDFVDFLKNTDNGLDTEFYFDWELQENNRVKQVTNIVNLQTNKLARHFISLGSSEVTVTPEDQSLFKIAVMSAIGKTADKHTDLEEQFDKLLKSPEVIALRGSGKAPEAFKEAALGFMQAHNETHALEAIEALMAYSETEQFNTRITIETDATTSGIGIGLMQFAQSLNPHISNLLAAIGVHQDGTNNQAEWKKDPAHRDNYQNIAIELYRGVRELVNTNNQVARTVQLFSVFFNLDSLVEDATATAASKEGRNFTKPGVTVYNYGSGKPSIIKKYVDEYILDRFYKAIESNDAETIENYKETIEKLVRDGVRYKIDEVRSGNLSRRKMEAIGNELIASGFANRELIINEDNIKLNLTTENNLTFTLEPKHIKYIEAAFNATYGDVLFDALETTFSDIAAARDNLIAVGNYLVDLYNNAYDIEVARIAAEKGIDPAQLSSEDHKEINDKLDRKLLPILKTGLMEPNEDPENVGLFIDNKEFQYIGEDFNNREDRENLNRTELVTKKPIGFNILNSDFTRSEGTPTGRYAVSSRYRRTVHPGPALLVNLIQAIDAALIQQSILGVEGLPIHDARLLNLANVVKGTQEYNDAFAAISDAYSIIDSVLERVGEVEQNLVDLGFDRNLIRTTKASLPEWQVQIDDAISELRGISRLNKIVKQNLAKNPDLTVTHAAFPNAQFSNKAKLKVTSVRVIKKQTSNGLRNYFDNLKSSLKDPQEIKNAEEAVIEIVEELNNPLADNYIEEVGNSPESFNLGQSVVTESVDAINTLKIFDELGTLDNTETTEHQEHLKDVLDRLVVSVLLPGESFVVNIENDPNFDKTLGSYNRTTGEINLKVATNPIITGFQQSAQETFAHELAGHAVVDYALDNNQILRNQLEKLYEQAKAFLNKDPNKQAYEYFLDDPAIATQEQIDKAKAIYNYIFESKNGLKEFGAFGITNARFIKILSNIPVAIEKKVPTNLKERVMNWYYQALEWMGGKILGYGSKATVDIALYKVMERLAKTNRKHSMFVKASRGITAGIEYINPKLSALMHQFMLDPLERFVNKPGGGKIRKSVRTLYKIKGFITGDEFLAFNQIMMLYTDKLTVGIFGNIANLIRKFPQELAGISEWNMKFRNLLLKSKYILDTNIQRIFESTLKSIKGSFHTEIDDEDKTAIYDGVLRTELFELTDVYSPKQLAKLLKSDSYRASQIKRYIDKIKSMYATNSDEYLLQAEALGIFMATGKNHLTDGLQLNAFNISRGYYNLRGFKAEGDLDIAWNLISKLRTLYAIENTSKDSRDRTADVIKREYDVNPDENGIRTTMNYHRAFKKDALARQFFDNPSLMMDGWTSEITNPNVDIVWNEDPNNLDLLSKGYEIVSVVGKDPKDTTNNNKIYMYLNQNAGLLPYMKTTVSLQDNHRKGTTLSELAYRLDPENEEVWKVSNKTVNTAYKRTVSNYKNKKVKIDREHTYLVPVMNPDGQYTDFRYMMDEKTRREYLDKTTDFSEVLARMNANIHSKVSSVKVNRAVVEELYTDYVTNYASNPKAYITISLKSTNPRYVEIYRMMPYEMRKDIEEVFGEDGFPIRESLVDIVFGYRKASITNFKGMDKKAVRFAEQVWQEAVGYLKHTIVIKTTVLYGNILSNFILGMLEGVPIDYMIKQKGNAVIALKNYMRDKDKLYQINLKLKSDSALNQDQITKLKNRADQLRTNIKNNPVKILINEGMLSSIVEDISLQGDVDKYSIESKVIDKFNEMGGKSIPKPLKEGWKHLYMAKGTPLYELLYKSTQFSDFAARFAMYNWFVNEKKMDQQEALIRILENFIDYESPTSRELQYLNDIGLAVFTKYAIRIQKIIWRLFLRRPGSALALQGIESIMNTQIYSPIDSLSLMPGLDNPFGMVDEVFNTLTANAVGAITPW
jgi:hypothetical protein